MLPGVFFGIALATAIWLWVSRRPFGILIVFVSTVIAWLAAEYIAERTFFFIGDMGNRIGLPNETGIFLSVVPGTCWGTDRQRHNNFCSFTCMQGVPTAGKLAAHSDGWDCFGGFDLILLSLDQAKAASLTTSLADGCGGFDRPYHRAAYPI